MTDPISIMKHYIGTKTLRACPMTRGEYNDYRGWEPPAGEFQETPGYLVEYDGPNGGAPNDPRHAGYISWSPADVFEGTYAEIPREADAVPLTDPIPTGVAVELLPYQQRVVEEHAELATKLRALLAFTGSTTFAAVDPAERERMLEQSAAMQRYLNILTLRINAFNGV